jgi:branched-chain amino acid transport system substrate-binding protein
MLNARTKVVVAAITAGVLIAAGCSKSSSNNSPTPTGPQPPLTIGISLSNSGDFSDPSAALKKGYDLWAEQVNKNGGILGRQVKLVYADDASSDTQVVTNYENFINKDKVDLVMGPFSTLLTAPAATRAARYNYAFIEPAGGGPLVFQAKLNNVFFAQPAPIVKCGDAYVAWIKSLPADKRPKTAAYPELDDPFAGPLAEAMRAQFEAMGIKTVYKQVYSSESADMTPIIAAVAAKNPDMVVSGTQYLDAYAQVKAMVQQNFSPKFLFMTNGAGAPTTFPQNVGAQNTEGIFSCGDWFPNSTANGNPDFVSAYIAKYGGTKYGIDPSSAEAYAAGQLLQDVAKSTGKIDNATIISALHSGTWPTVEGNLSWDQYGSPLGSDMAVEWISGKLLPVYPPEVALASPVYPKPPWGG